MIFHYSNMVKQVSVEMATVCQEIQHLSQPTGFISSRCLCSEISLEKKFSELNLRFKIDVTL